MSTVDASICSAFTGPNDAAVDAPNDTAINTTIVPAQQLPVHAAIDAAEQHAV
jgi:hypothetical protein